MGNLEGSLPQLGGYAKGTLSPYIYMYIYIFFFFCAEGLSALIKQFVEQGMLKGVAASMRGPKISHLFFVDDNLIFCGTTHEDCATLENILETYCSKLF